jgi:hypothetical protein
MDSISSARVPMHFLLRFELTYSTGTDHNDDAAKAPIPSAKNHKAQLAFIPTQPSHVAVTSYVVANHTVMPELQQRAGAMVNMSHRQLFARATGLAAKKLTVQWNPELPDKVLSGLRKVVVDEISTCVDMASPTGESHGESLAAPETTDLFVEHLKDDSSQVKSVACLLCVDEDAAGSDLPHEGPKYNLPHLLGVELAAEVVQTIGLSELCTIGVVKHARVTPLLVALERLRMYIS